MISQKILLLGTREELKDHFDKLLIEQNGEWLGKDNAASDAIQDVDFSIGISRCLPYFLVHFLRRPTEGAFTIEQYHCFLR